MGGLVPVERIKNTIFQIRGKKVMLDSDLAELYGVPVKVFNQAVKRNKKRFPHNFMFQLSAGEYQALRSQIVTLKTGRGVHRKYLPYVFTEHGALMAASVLNTQRAIEVSVFVIQAFVKLREMAWSYRKLAQRLTELERKFKGHDEQIRSLFEAIRQLMMPPQHSHRRIGFHTS